MKREYDLVELVAVLTRLVGDWELAFLKELESAGMTARQLHYLDTIAELGNPTYVEVARALRLSKPSVTAAVTRLAANGFVRRVSSDQDRRSAHIHLTKKGTRLVDRHDAVHRNIASIFQENLRKDELSQLTRLVNKVVRKVNHAVI